MPERFTIDRTSAAPVYAQLVEQVRLMIHSGELRAGDPMPTVRALAVALGINANTVARVYRELQAQGLLRLERGVGTFVAAAPAGPRVARSDYARIEDKARELVGLCREAGLTAREMTQLVDSTWKETS